MRENLFFRTDILPHEIPLLFDNKNIYKHFEKNILKKHNEFERDKKNSKINLNTLITVPSTFLIPKKSNAYRKISLLHPIAQLQVFNYILRYDNQIVNFCKESEFSVRSPVIRNKPVLHLKDSVKKTWERLEEEFSFSKSTTVTTEEDEALFYSYFSYKNFKRLQDLYDSNKFNRDKYKFTHFIKFDIQDFFPSIYSHSLSWAIFGDKALAKNLKGKNHSEIFANATDIISQKINFNETNGVVVGPEFSRITAEILMTRVDMNVLINLKNKGIIHKKDYSMYRFVDDYFVFTNNKDISLEIKKTVSHELDKFNLKMNSSKTVLQERPFEIQDHSITELKNAFSAFQYNYSRYLESSNNKRYSSWEKNIWKDLYYNLELLINKYPESKNRIINYSLKKIRSLIPEQTQINKYNLAYILEIISNIFVLNINTSSTNYTISLFIKVARKLEESGNDDYDEEYETYINEKIFQHLYTVIKNNSKDISHMFDLLIYLKRLKKKIPSSYLCSLIERNSECYFVLCSIAYYILNDEKNRVSGMYITVYKKLRSAIFNIKDGYRSKGADNKILEADYFYFINDFSYYPGFYASDKMKLKNQIYKDIRALNFQNPNNDINFLTEMFEKISISSYYGWEKSTETFEREVAKKTINFPNSKGEDSY